MSHKCFISFKKEDVLYKDAIVRLLKKEEVIVKSLDWWIDSDDDKYIMEKIRKDLLGDSTVTIFLIGEHSSENEGEDEDGDKSFFIKRELRASLYNGEPPNTRNGILGIVLPSMYAKIYGGSQYCERCKANHNIVNVNDTTVVREFSANYYVKPPERCAWPEEERYCVLTTYDEFVKDPEKWINMAYDKRSSAIADKVTVRPVGKYS